MKYNIFVEKYNNSYSAFCPTLPGCVATGKTILQVLKRMQKAVALHRGVPLQLVNLSVTQLVAYNEQKTKQKVKLTYGGYGDEKIKKDTANIIFEHKGQKVFVDLPESFFDDKDIAKKIEQEIDTLFQKKKAEFLA